MRRSAVRWIGAGLALSTVAALVTWRSAATVWYGGMIVGAVWVARGVRSLRGLDRRRDDATE
jgi:hypothetical protein